MRNLKPIVYATLLATMVACETPINDTDAPPPSTAEVTTTAATDTSDSANVEITSEVPETTTGPEVPPDRPEVPPE